MDSYAASQNHLDTLGASLGRSLHRHLVENPAVQAAFQELAFELELARQVYAQDLEASPALIESNA